MLHRQHTTPRIPVIAESEYLPYYDRFGYHHPLTTYVMTGFAEYRVRGKVRGDDLRVDCRGRDVTRLMPATVQTHEDAIAWTRCQLGEQEPHA